MKHEEIIKILKAVEPGYELWNDKEIDEQIECIEECGYKWFEKNGKVGFKHSESGIYLKVAGLNYYSPKEIKKTYEEVWSKDFEGVKKRTKKVKFFKASLVTMFSSITFIFLKWEVALIIVGLLAVRTIYFYYNYKQLENK